MHRYKCKEGWRSPKTPQKIPAKPRFNKKESCIAKKEERKVFKVGEKSSTPAGCEKNNIPFQKVQKVFCNDTKFSGKYMNINHLGELAFRSW